MRIYIAMPKRLNMNVSASYTKKNHKLESMSVVIMDDVFHNDEEFVETEFESMSTPCHSDSCEEDEKSFLHGVWMQKQTPLMRIFWIGTGLQTCIAMETLLVSPHLSDISNDFGFNARQRDLEVGGILTFVVFVVGVPMQYILGLIGDSYDKRNIIAVFCMLGAVSNISVFFVHSFTLFVGLRCISSVSAMTSTVFVSLLSNMFEMDERSAIIGRYNALRGAGVGMGVLLSSFTGQWSWRIPFVVVGLACLVFTAIFYNKIPPFTNQSNLLQSTKTAMMTQTTSNIVFSVPSCRFSVPMMLRSSTNIALFIQAPFFMLPIEIVGIYMIDWFYNTAGAPSKLSALVVTASFALGNVVGQVNFSFCATFLGKTLISDKSLTFFTSATLHTIPIIPLCFVWSSSFSFWLILPCLFSGFTTGLNMTLTRTLLLNLNEKSQHASIFSVYCIMENVGKGIGVLLFSSLMSHGNRDFFLMAIPSVWLLPAAILFFCCILHRFDKWELWF